MFYDDESLRLARANYDAAISNLFVNMEVMRLTGEILRVNSEHLEIARKTHELLLKQENQNKNEG